MLVSYQWIKEYIGPTTPPVETLVELLTFHAFEVEEVTVVGEDTVIDVKILPDRSSDCLCQRGIARELATLLNTTLAHDPLARVPSFTTTADIVVRNENPELVPRFTASLITGITVGPSPQWLVDRLASLGQRSINNIVDATNYVMYAIGQPIHAYDADAFPKVEGTWQFGVRQAKTGETVALLAEGGKEGDRIVTLKGGELLIIDDSSGTPIGLAGVKGGRFAGVHAGTKNIIIEAAHFDPVRTRKTARGLGIVIDASKRFENEPSRQLPPYAQAEIIALITDIAGGTPAGYMDSFPIPKVNPQVHVRTDHVNALLGLSLSGTQMLEILRRVGIEVVEEADGFLCTGPWERTDLNIPQDFIEEIGRVYGYHHITSVVPDTMPLKEYNARHYYSEIIRGVLIAHGATEVITSSFRSSDEITLQSALASDKGCLRSSLIKNISEALDKNAPHTDLVGTTDTRLFEIGTVFYKHDASVSEFVSVCIGVRQKPSGYTPKDDVLLDSLILLVEQALGVTPTWKKDKGVAECNLTDLLTLLPAPSAYTPVPLAPEVSYQAFSMYPSVSRDIAMWVGEGTDVGAVEAILKNAAGPLLVRLTHLDTFTKEGRTSLAFRLVFQSNETTLEGGEVDTYMNAVYEAVAAAGFEAR